MPEPTLTDYCRSLQRLMDGMGASLEARSPYRMRISHDVAALLYQDIRRQGALSASWCPGTPGCKDVLEPHIHRRVRRIGHLSMIALKEEE